MTDNAASREVSRHESVHEYELPFAERSSANIPGHWLLARLGKRVLRPGGLELTEAMLDHAMVDNHDIIEFAPGLGRTATEILNHHPSSYVGVDEDPKAAAVVSRIVGSLGHCVNANAKSTHLPDASADVVVGEAMLTMQSNAGKRQIVAEAARLLRKGGRYAIHELGLQPDILSNDTKNTMQKDLARAIKVNARPLTAEEWTSLLQAQGFSVDWVSSAPMALLDVRRNLSDEGIVAVLRIVKNLVKDRQARERVMAMKRTFTKYRKHMNGIAIVAHKLD